ncbi:Cyclic nucleotide-binding domain-containing protein 2 [Oopsacas minuta]|uniref:Cyclic nucleotide-binding domain-containing protein 2 n=1 Tax=Oopsacas minuta TaxID=111878 RepID=A0AAV7JN90_9METZ|nr:Cyclic nucleotide-binding domain-containing protein 2 [Oopsacas minuta]
MEEDQTTLNLEKTKIVTELREGSSFGELALIHECKKRATIVSKEMSELLVVHKEDFEVVMKKMTEQDWEIRHNFFKQFKYMQSWSDSKISIITESSSIEEFSPNTVIFRNFPKKDHVYFIVTGQCKVVQDIELYEKKLFQGYNEYYLKRSHSNPDLFRDLGAECKDESLYHDNDNQEFTER